MRKMLFTVVAIASWCFIGVTHSVAQSDFYQGKTIRIIVGFSPGGGYDALARML